MTQSISRGFGYHVRLFLKFQGKLIAKRGEETHSIPRIHAKGTFLSCREYLEFDPWLEPMRCGTLELSRNV